MKRILLLFLSMLCLVGANAQVTVEQVVNSTMGTVSNNSTWTSISTFPNSEFINHPLTIFDQNANSEYDLEANTNGFVVTVANGHLSTSRTHTVTINAPEGWIIAGCSFTVNKTRVDVTANGINVGTSYDQESLNLSTFTISIKHSTGRLTDTRGNATFTNFKIKLRNEKVASMIALAVAQSTDLPTKSSYKKAETAPTNGNPTPFLITSTSNNCAFSNSTTAVDMTLSNNEYIGEVNMNGKPYTFVFEPGGKIKCNNTQYLNASFGGWSASDSKATLSLANSSNTTWTIEKKETGEYSIYCRQLYWTEYVNFYLTAPNNANGTFSLTKDNTQSVQILNGVVKPLTFKIQTDYATLYCEDAYEMPGTDIIGYFIEDAQKTGELTPIKRYRSGSVVPAKTSLLLTGTQGTYNATRYVEKAGGVKYAPNYSDVNLNQLEGHRGANNTTATERDYDVYYYKLAWNDSHTKLGFFWGAPEGGPFQMSNDYAAYLTVSKQAGARGFSLPSPDELDDDVISSIGINTVEPRNENDAIYTVSGMRVNSTTTLPAGIYIRNGKKFIVR